jgi:hypothetical protein
MKASDNDQQAQMKRQLDNTKRSKDKMIVHEKATQHAIDVQENNKGNAT